MPAYLTVSLASFGLRRGTGKEADSPLASPSAKAGRGRRCGRHRGPWRDLPLDVIKDSGHDLGRCAGETVLSPREQRRALGERGFELV